MRSDLEVLRSRQARPYRCKDPAIGNPVLHFTNDCRDAALITPLKITQKISAWVPAKRSAMTEFMNAS
jgi:hypothetical protein